MRRSIEGHEFLERKHVVYRARHARVRFSINKRTLFRSRTVLLPSITAVSRITSFTSRITSITDHLAGVLASYRGALLYFYAAFDRGRTFNDVRRPSTGMYYTSFIPFKRGIQIRFYSLPSPQLRLKTRHGF